jgi:hypothetical protein
MPFFNITYPIACLRVTPGIRVSQAEGHWPGRPGFESWQRQLTFLYSITYRLPLKCTQSRIQRVMGTLFRRVKLPEGEATPSPPYSDDSNKVRPIPRLPHKEIKKQPSWPLARRRTIPTERPPLVGEIQCQLLWIEGCRVVSAVDPLGSLISVFYGVATFLSSSSSFILTRAEWTPFQTHCYSENLVSPVIEPGTSGLAARNSDR